MRLLTGLLLALIFLMVAGLAVLLLNTAYIKTNHYKNTLQPIEKFINGVPKNLEAVNFGSTYAYFDLSYQGTGVNGFNFGLPPQTLSYDYKILRQYSSHFQENCIVLIVLPDLVFGFTDPQDDNSNIKYYYFLEKEMINNYRFSTCLSKVKLPVLSAKKKIKYIVRDQKADVSYSHEKNPLTPAQIKEQAEIRIAGWKTQFHIDNMTDDNFSEKLKEAFAGNIKTVTEMIAYCLHNNYRPVLLVPPVSEVLNNKYTKKFIDGVLYDNIKKANGQNIPVLDYLYDERFQDSGCYINADLMNKTGRLLFTQTVLDDLRKIGYIQN